MMKDSVEVKYAIVKQYGTNFLSLETTNSHVHCIYDQLKQSCTALEVLETGLILLSMTETELYWDVLKYTDR